MDGISGMVLSVTLIALVFDANWGRLDTFAFLPSFIGGGLSSATLATRRPLETVACLETSLRSANLLGAPEILVRLLEQDMSALSQGGSDAARSSS